MPPKVAEWLMNENISHFGDNHRNTSGDINSLFRPFNINSMKVCYKKKKFALKFNTS